MGVFTDSLRCLITTARNLQNSIDDFNGQLLELKKPVISDTSLLPSIYAVIQSQTSAESLREQRLCFVFIAAWLYCPSSIIANHPLKPGLRTAISKVIGRCKGEISAIFTEAKFRYDHLDGFRDKIDKILAKYLHYSN